MNKAVKDIRLCCFLGGWNYICTCNNNNLTGYPTMSSSCTGILFLIRMWKTNTLKLWFKDTMNLIVLGTPPPPCYPELVGACIWTIYSDTDTLEVVNEQFIGGWPLSSRWSILGSACPMKKLNEPYKGPETERCRLRALTKHIDKLGPYKRKKCVSPWNPDGVKKRVSSSPLTGIPNQCAKYV